jgi:hypothetical protein
MSQAAEAGQLRVILAQVRKIFLARPQVEQDSDPRRRPM